MTAPRAKITYKVGDAVSWTDLRTEQFHTGVITDISEGMVCKVKLDKDGKIVSKFVFNLFPES